MREPFVWGQGGKAMTPDEVERQRQLVALAQGRMGDTSPVGHWTQGAARVVDALGGVLREKRTDRAEAAGLAGADAYVQNNPVLSALIGGGGSGVSAMPAPMMAQQPVDPNAQLGADAMAAIGQPANTGGYRESLIGTESGGNFGARNNEVGAGGQRGHFGRVQFGHARLRDAMNAGVIPQGTTPEAFMASPELQIAAENWHFSDLERQLAPYVGTVVNGQALDMGALVAMGHLGGANGARRYVESGGSYNPSDSFGTSLSEYAQTHGGTGGGMSSSGQSMPVTGGGGDVIAALTGAMADPWVAQKYGPVIESLLGQQMDRQDQQFSAQLAQQDPLYQAQLQTAQLELEGLRNPPPPPPPGAPETQKIFDPATGQEQIVQWNGAEWVPLGGVAAPSGPLVENNIGADTGQYLYGSAAGLPAGWRLDVATGQASEIPNGPAAQEAAASAAAAANAAGSDIVATDTITTAANRAREAATQRQAGGLARGLWLPLTHTLTVQKLNGRLMFCEQMRQLLRFKLCAPHPLRAQQALAH
ncbi:MAG: hypothetical protein U5N55_12660 [Cypionkella sp.]|nr:hypothetical protein [Cypionkella sp.]